MTHIDENGAARIVDIGAKTETMRRGIASVELLTRADVVDAILGGKLKKGDAVAVARVAGIMAAKKTAELIPLCHPIPITKITIDIGPAASANAIIVVATVETVGRTGVEMEAMTAASVTALTLYDMAKAIDKSMIISNLRLIEKTGGKSGDYRLADHDIG